MLGRLTILTCLLLAPGPALADEVQEEATPAPAPFEDSEEEPATDSASATAKPLSSRFGGPLKITKGTITLGNSATFGYATTFGGRAGSSFEFNLSPALGYFLMDGLWLKGSLGLSGTFGDPTYGSVGVDAAIIKIWDIGHRFIYPFVGGGLGISLGWGDYGATSFRLHVPGGIYVAIATYAGLWVALQLTYAYVAADPGYSQIEIDGGAFGITTFF